MIKEAYVSFEVAKLLKEKGFSENTVCKYADVGGIIEKWYDDYRERVLRFDWEEGYLIEPSIEPKDQYEIIGDTISAPTHQMAMAWLREVYDINIDVVSIWEQKRWEYQIYIITPTTSNCPYKDDTLYMTYEEAVEVALKYSLENLV